MADYRTDRQWSDKFIPHLKHIIADLLIKPASEDDDMHKNTDLIVFRVETLRVACRVRRYSYLAEYGRQFTIRTERTNGRETELAKLIKGYGDYFIYAFADNTETDLSAWHIIDLREFRLWYMNYLIFNHGKRPGIPRKNGDQSSNFDAFSIDSIAPKALILTTLGAPTP